MEIQHKGHCMPGWVYSDAETFSITTPSYMGYVLVICNNLHNVHVIISSVVIVNVVAPSVYLDLNCTLDFKTLIIS